MRQDGRQTAVTRAATVPRWADLDAARRERRIAAFATPYQDRIREISDAGPELEDLADSFPAALFALAAHDIPAAERSALIGDIVAGLPLKDVAQRLDLPWWVRRLPAQAFTGPLGPLPADAGFGLRIGPLLPICEGMAGEWLRRVSMAYAICGVDAATWVARHFRSTMPIAADEHFHILCAWIWHADKPETPAGALIRKPWSAQQSARRATEEIIGWRRRIALARHIGRGFGDTWVEDGTALGYRFVALRTIFDFIGEAELMDNCLDQYAARLEQGPIRVFSVRKDGRTVADVEIAPHEQEASMPCITQVRAPRNRRASPDIWRAAYAWLGGQALKPADLGQQNRQLRARRSSERAIWAPYLAALPPNLAEQFVATVILAPGRRRGRREPGTRR